MAYNYVIKSMRSDYANAKTTLEVEVHEALEMMDVMRAKFTFSIEGKATSAADPSLVKQAEEFAMKHRAQLGI